MDARYVNYVRICLQLAFPVAQQMVRDSVWSQCYCISRAQAIGEKVSGVVNVIPQYVRVCECCDVMGTGFCWL